MGARQSRYKKLEEVHELEPKVNGWLRQHQHEQQQQMQEQQQQHQQQQQQQQHQQQQQPKGVQGSEDKEYKPK